MQSTLIRMPIASFRRIENLFEREGKRMYVAVIKAGNLPRELDEWRKINPRDPSTTSGVAKKIKSSFEDSPRSFFFKNRGITLLVGKSSFDTESNELSLELSNQNLHGMLDGGHTYRIIRESLESLSDSEKNDFNEAYVRLEILEGFVDPGEVVDIVEARNTSTQVKDQSLEELKGHFDTIKTVLSNENYSNRVAYREIELAEDGNKKDIDIKEILSYLVCFDVEAFGDGKKHPIIAYSSKGAVLKHIKENRERMEKYLNLLPQILQLRDIIYEEMPKAYNSMGGYFGKLTGVIEISNTKKSPIELSFIGKESNYVIPSAFIYPILSSLRNLVDCRENKCSWKKDPVIFFELLKDELVQRVIEQAKEFRNPNKLGKDNATWGRCYDYVALEVLKLKI